MTAARTSRLAALVLASLALVACAPAEVTPTAPMALDGVTLTVEPLPQASCDAAQPFAARVRWSVADWDDPKFDVHLVGSHGKLWARINTARGESMTDPFVTPGLFFVMLDRNSRQMIAATPAPALVCPAG